MIKIRIRIKVERRTGRKNDRRRSLIAGQAYGSNGGLPSQPRTSGRRRGRKRRRKSLRGAKIKK